MHSPRPCGPSSPSPPAPDYALRRVSTQCYTPVEERRGTRTGCRPLCGRVRGRHHGRVGEPAVAFDKYLGKPYLSLAPIRSYRRSTVVVTQDRTMSAEKIALLGAIAGFTIYLGLPIGRLRYPVPRLRALLNAIAIGILIFLLWDVLAHAWEPIDGALSEHHYGPATGNGLVLAIGFGAGLVGLVYFDRWVAGRTRREPGIGSRHGDRLRTQRWPGRRTARPGRSAGDADRRRYRAAQLRRGSGHRQLRRQGRDRPRGAADHRLRHRTTPPRASASSPRWRPPETAPPGVTSHCSA